MNKILKDIEKVILKNISEHLKYNLDEYSLLIINTDNIDDKLFVSQNAMNIK